MPVWPVAIAHRNLTPVWPVAIAHRNLTTVWPVAIAHCNLTTVWPVAVAETNKTNKTRGYQRSQCIRLRRFLQPDAGVARSRGRN